MSVRGQVCAVTTGVGLVVLSSRIEDNHPVNATGRGVDRGRRPLKVILLPLAVWSFAMQAISFPTCTARFSSVKATLPAWRGAGGAGWGGYALTAVRGRTRGGDGRPGAVPGDVPGDVRRNFWTPASWWSGTGWRGAGWRLSCVASRPFRISPVLGGGALSGGVLGGGVGDRYGVAAATEVERLAPGRV